MLERALPSVYEHFERSLAAIANPATKIGLSIAEAMSWDYFAALRCCLNGEQLRGRCRESEYHQEMVKRNPHYLHKPHAMLVPAEVQCVPLAGVRALSVASASAGGFLTDTQNVSFIDLLRNSSVTTALGARRVSGLKSNVTLPKQTGGGTTYWLANESSAIGETNLQLGQVAMTPKHVAYFTQISRQLLLQSSPSVSGRVFADAGRGLALAQDLAVITGTGANGQPLGVLNTPGIGSVTGTSLDYADIVEFQSHVLAGKDVDLMSAGYAAPVAVALLLMGRHAVTGTYSPLWSGNLASGQLGGCRAMSSAQMPAGSLLFGVWSSVLIGEWNLLELEIDPFTGFREAIYGLRAILTCDVAIEHPESFSVATSVS